MFLSEKLSSLTENNFLSITDQSYVLLKVENLINFSLPTVLSRDLECEVRVVLSTHTREKYLVLPPPPDISADVDDLLTDTIFGENIVELLHGFVNDFLHRKRDVHLHDEFLVS